MNKFKVGDVYFDTWSGERYVVTDVRGRIIDYKTLSPHFPLKNSFFFDNSHRAEKSILDKVYILKQILEKDK